ncbi:MAG: MMPL family transporter [Desulfosalsimonas sp.]
MKPLPVFSGYSPLKSLVFVLALVLAAVAAVSVFNLKFETNVIKSLPTGSEAMEHGAHVLEHHPYQNRIFIDLSLKEKDPDRLVEAAEFVEARLGESGLFKTTGTGEMGRLFPELMSHVAENLPLLFTARELENQIAPLLEKNSLEQSLRQNLSRLYTMENVGRSRLVLKDPMGLSNLVLKKLRHLLPAGEVNFRKGQLLSADKRHLLVTATPKADSSGAESARRIDSVIEKTSRMLEQKFKDSGRQITITPVGSYRAVIDNETAAKADTKNALSLATLGIALLLILSFPRPYIGLLAFLPAVFGTVCALAFYSIWNTSISVMSIGFGGAIIAITVDHGISYLLFLDRPYETSGREVSREVRAVALIAALTSAGAFFMLTFSGFPILAEIGQFAAFGIAFSFIFVHSCFPLIFPTLKPAGRGKRLLLQRGVDRIASGGGGYKPAAALAFLAVMAFFADPEFSVDISSMNTVRGETLAAEDQVSDVWGEKLFERIYLMAEARDLQALQRQSDRLAGYMEAEKAGKTISEAFLPSAVFPGKQRCKDNIAAWRSFWQDHDRELLEKKIRKTASSLGMPDSAFAGVYEADTAKCESGLAVSEKFHEMLGIYQSRNSGQWMLFTTLAPGQNYDPKEFFNKYSDKDGIYVFDPGYYSKAVSLHLSDTFTSMLIFIGVSITVLLLLLFMDLVLTVIALLPVFFSLICTLGVISLIGIPLNIPGLMLSVVVLGMGLDYSLYLVRAYQRYRDERHPYQSHIRMTVFLAGVSTLIGFGALALGEHNLMKSLGQVLVIGIGFVMAGAFALLPFFLRYLFQPAEFSTEPAIPGTKMHRKRFIKLYKHLEAYPRLFARFKHKTDPMFSELPGLISNPSTVIDIGCGFGVTAAWLISANPQIRIYGADPNPERARIAGRIVDTRGRIFTAGAPDLPDFNLRADLALMLDMLHYISDNDLRETLQKLRKALQPGAALLIRTTIATKSPVPIFRRIETFQNRLKGITTYYRPQEQIKTLLEENGFALCDVRPSGVDSEETWFLAEAPGANKQGFFDD